MIQLPEIFIEDNEIHIDSEESRVFMAHCRVGEQIHNIRRVVSPLEWTMFGEEQRFRDAMSKSVAHELVEFLLEQQLAEL